MTTYGLYVYMYLYFPLIPRPDQMFPNDPEYTCLYMTYICFTLFLIKGFAVIPTYLRHAAGDPS